MADQPTDTHTAASAPKGDHSSEQAAIHVSIPPVSTAEDTSFVSSLAAIVNAVYKEAEEGIFLPSYQRVSPTEVADFLRQGQLAVATLGSTGAPVGCVLVKCLSPERGDFAMLALDPAHRGGGLGRQMVSFAENECRGRGCSIMQLELLVPTTFRHAFKERLQSWYLRMGYQVVKLGSFDEEYPQLAKILAGPAEYRIFEKSLV